MTDMNPRKADSLEINEAEDGLVVYDPVHDMVHHLNPSAALIFELCDGTRDADAIAQVLQEAWSLDAPPADDVHAGLEELAELKLID
jgi:PqqD family protein of HPr-rel-A system